MIEQWPIECDALKSEGNANPRFKDVQDFVHLLGLLPNVINSFDDVITWIVRDSGDITEFKERIALTADNIPHVNDDTPQLLMTLACAVVLAREPSLDTWKKVNTFRYHSWEIESWLSKAMMAYVETDSSASDAYTKLAKIVFVALEDFSLETLSKRGNEERKNSFAYWEKNSSKLEEIWLGLRGGADFTNYHAELTIFDVLYKLNPDEFINSISKSRNPYLVSSLLFVTGVGAFSPKFSDWKRMINASPNAFEDDGKWNGSILMPLLLVDARNQLLHITSNTGYSDITQDEIETNKQKVTSTVNLIVTTLAARQDAISIFTRWTPWLMRQTLGSASQDLADVRSSAFADNSLIEAISRKLKNCQFPQTLPDDAFLWEAWCYRCVLASYAYDGNIELPNWEGFIDEWRLSPEDWSGDKGQSLRNRSSIVISLSKETQSIAANLLAYPIAQSSAPVKAWIDLWNDAIVLRDIVEFGDSDVTTGEYRSRSEAGQLLQFLMSIGLAIFDQVASRTFDESSIEARCLTKLFTALNSAASEMREIDSTFNNGKWLLIIQHLIIRRMIWQSTSKSESSSTKIQVFKVDDTPTISDMLIKEKGNVVEMTAILQSLLLNDSDSTLKSILHSASIDVSEILQSIKKLNDYHQNKYPINEAQLKKLEVLI